MRATCKIDAAALVQCGPASSQRGACRAPGALDHLWRPWETDTTDLGRIQCSVADPLQVSGIVRTKDVNIGRRIRNAEIVRRENAGSDQTLSQSSVLDHRKAMASRQR
ncbi:hypothetical protein SDC9_197895 [bioreactor metagenome]|uniref:Uncharacterized protein n=1 Tax=bioreactor metagenome TaxID=1076179 RepID=A0A645IIG0_9ZZZZ